MIKHSTVMITLLYRCGPVRIPPRISSARSPIAKWTQSGDCRMHDSNNQVAASRQLGLAYGCGHPDRAQNQLLASPRPGKLGPIGSLSIP
jgi:hypothetical protein